MVPLGSSTRSPNKRERLNPMTSPGSRKVDRTMPRRDRRHHLKPASVVRKARNLAPLAEHDSRVVVRPEDLHDLARPGGVNWHQSSKAIRSHGVPPVVGLAPTCRRCNCGRLPSIKVGRVGGYTDTHVQRVHEGIEKLSKDQIQGHGCLPRAGFPVRCHDSAPSLPGLSRAGPLDRLGSMQAGHM